MIAVRADGRSTLPRALLGGSVVGFPSAYPETGPVPARLAVLPAGPRFWPRPPPPPGRRPCHSPSSWTPPRPPGASKRLPGRPRTSPPALGGLGLDSIDIATDGSQPAVEQARTALANANAYPSLGTPLTLGEVTANITAPTHGYQQLVDVVILASLAIAGCTLATAIAAGLTDRKRPFSLLRLAGARLATLRRVVALESAVPLLVVAAVSIGVGFGAAAMFASVQLQRPLVPPGAAYYLLTAAGIAASLGIIAATFPLLRRLTGPEAARNE